MENPKCLLLNASYQVISFINYKKLFKLLIKGKVEIISSFNIDVNWIDGRIKHPSVVRLKNHVKTNYYNRNFSRKALVKRDRSHCQYCHIKLTASQITIDHVVPRAQGGITSFSNCVVACQDCNNKKADRTPEQAGMKLLRRPTHPSFSAIYLTTDPQEMWHEAWNDYLSH